MPVGGVSGATGSSGAASSAMSSALSGVSDQFMKILLTELRYQDPMDPMKDRDFFTQMAQFTTAANMEDLKNSMAQVAAIIYQGQMNQNLMSAASLIGRQFQATVDGVSVFGVIEAVALRDSQIMVRSGEYELPADSLTLIGGYLDADQDV
jgi:flagellar basal-body rod modification protein FlgD